jgi:hypothetical protein
MRNDKYCKFYNCYNYDTIPIQLVLNSFSLWVVSLQLHLLLMLSKTFVLMGKFHRN